MTRRELKEIIAGGESSTVEFKRKFTSPEKIAREVIAFANCHGGFLLVGVDDDKTVYGIESEKEEESLMRSTCEFWIDPPIDPTIEIVNIEYKDVLVVIVEESSRKPHRLVTTDPNEKPHQRVVYIRQGDKTLAASKEVSKVLEAKKPETKPLTLGIGNNEHRLFAYLEKNERITAKEYAKLINVSERRAIRLLVRLVRAGVVAIHTHEKTDYYTLFS